MAVLLAALVATWFMRIRHSRPWSWPRFASASVSGGGAFVVALHVHAWLTNWWPPGDGAATLGFYAIVGGLWGAQSATLWRAFAIGFAVLLGHGAVDVLAHGVVGVHRVTGPDRALLAGAPL